MTRPKTLTWPFSSHVVLDRFLNLLCLSFLIYKMGIRKAPTAGGDCDDSPAALSYKHPAPQSPDTDSLQVACQPLSWSIAV